MLREPRRLLAYVWPIRIGLGLVLLYAAVPKLGDLAGTVQSVEAYNLLPTPLAVAFGYALPFGELTLGLLLVLGMLTRLAALGGAALMLSFVVAIGVNLARGDAPSCGCFGADASSPIDWTTLARDVGLLLGMALVYLDSERRVSLDRWIAGAPCAAEAEPAAAEEGS